MNRPYNVSVVVLVVSGLLCCDFVLASNGYFPHGVGVRNKAMAGAGMAMPEEAISIVNNPAVAAFLENRTDVGVSVFMPNRNYSTFFGGNQGDLGSFSFGTVNIDSDEDVFIIPEIARSRQMGNGSAFAWAIYTRSGIGATYKGGEATFDPDATGPLGVSTFQGTYGDGTAGLEISQALVDITWAKKLGEETSYGISAVLAAQSLEAQGLGGLSKYSETFAASNGSHLPDNLSGNGRDVNYGVGLKVGLHRLLGENFALGVMYQSKINIGSSADYADLLAGGGDLDIPAWFRLGLTWQPKGRFSYNIDIQHILYSKIDALGNSFTNIYDCPTAGFAGTDLSRCLGGKNGPGFDWKDVPVVSFGGSWNINERWTVRAGVSLSDQPVKASENTFNTLLVNLTEVHYTAGFSRKLSNGHDLSFALMYSEEESIEAQNQLDESQILLLTSDQWDFQMSYSWGD